MDKLYQKYIVKIKLGNKLYGGKPKNKELIKNWLKARGRANTLNKEIEEIDLIEEEKKAWTGFKIDDRGVYIDSYQIKGLIKEVCKVLRLYVKNKGLKTLIESGFFVYPAKIYLMRDGDIIKQVDGYDEDTAVVNGMAGKRSILKRADYVLEPEIIFEIHYFNTGILTEKILYLILEAGEKVGLGTNRHLGAGQFDIIEIKKKMK